MMAPGGFARSFSAGTAPAEREDGSEEIFGHDRILLAHRERMGLMNDTRLVGLETIGVAVRTNVDLAGDDRVTTETHLVKGGILDDTARPFGTFG